MKYASTLFLSLLIVLFVAAGAQAAPEGSMKGSDKPNAPAPHQDPVKKEAAAKLFEGFQIEIDPIYTQLHSKTLQLQALSGNSSADPGVIARLSDEIAGLHSDMRAKWREFRTRAKNELGPDAHRYFGGEQMVFPDPALYYDGWPLYGYGVSPK
ncbi:MAG: hypothetical protein IJD04_02430, partial [Desulfovibrionaceae bacterium]|nr:hypothetical protein [Desulfovibrionaceae bacterium]